jgi:hypothetical protein
VGTQWCNMAQMAMQLHKRHQLYGVHGL